MATDETVMTPEEDALVWIHTRNEFYKKKYRFALGVYFLSILVIIFLIGLLVYILKHPVRPTYFVADSVGRLIQDVPVTQPNMSLDDVMAWTIEAVENAYSYDFVNYRGQLQDTQKYFTEFGWMNFLNGLRASNNVLALTERQMVFQAKVVDKPTLIIASLLGGAYAYKFEMPLLVTYLSPPNYDDKSAFRNPYKISVIVQRQKLLQSYRGLGIVQLNAEAVAGGSQAMTATPTS